MKLTLEMLSADKRRAKREVVKTFHVETGHEIGEHESIERLQRARKSYDDAIVHLSLAEGNCQLAEEALLAARRDVRRVSER